MSIASELEVKYTVVLFSLLEASDSEVNRGRNHFLNLVSIFLSLYSILDFHGFVHLDPTLVKTAA